MTETDGGLKVLHVWNTAGVASVIAKFTNRLFGLRSTVITRAAADRVGLTTTGKAYDDGPAVFFARALLMSRRFDLVQVHSLDRLVPWIKRLYPSKPVVMHYHGTDIGGRWAEKAGRWMRADLVAYSTPNLASGAPSGAIHVPNPIDTDLFHPGSSKRDLKSALTFRYGMDERAEQVAIEKSLDLTLVDRWSVQHSQMPALLSRFGYFIDLRRPLGHEVASSVGKAALEALACGCSVIDWSGNVLSVLPEENMPENVAAKWHELYQGILRT